VESFGGFHCRKRKKLFFRVLDFPSSGQEVDNLFKNASTTSGLHKVHAEQVSQQTLKNLPFCKTQRADFLSSNRTNPNFQK
jgi:hypothetical protein